MIVVVDLKKPLMTDRIFGLSTERPEAKQNGKCRHYKSITNVKEILANNGLTAEQIGRSPEFVTDFPKNMQAAEIR